MFGQVKNGVYVPREKAFKPCFTVRAVVESKTWDTKVEAGPDLKPLSNRKQKEYKPGERLLKKMAKQHAKERVETKGSRSENKGIKAKRGVAPRMDLFPNSFGFEPRSDEFFEALMNAPVD